MNIVRSYGTRPHWQKLIMFVLLVAFGTGINLCGAYTASRFSLSLYLDCMGTMLASILGGYMQGITVGLLSSLINGIIDDPKLMSYGSLNVFIALFTAWAATHKWFKKPTKIILAVFIYAFLGGFLGTIITLNLYGFAQDDASKPVVLWFANMGFSNMTAEFIGDYCVDIFDKALSLSVCLLIVSLIPADARGQFRIHSWRQAPLRSSAVKVLLKNKTRSMSLRTKIIALHSLLASLVALASFFFSYVLYEASIRSFALDTGIDIDEGMVNAWSEQFLLNQLSLFVGVFILIVSIALYISRYDVILPMNSMSLILDYYSNQKIRNPREVQKIFEGLKIRTGDEIENLYYIILSMIKENADALEDIHHKNATISDMQNALIIVLADIVESRDHNTGNHIKSTAEYVEIIIDEMLIEGTYLDQLTPKFISDVYQSAPLHDIGKISISDVVLNKPGKLTDEEFALMKKHSSVGAEIIERVIATLPDSGDLGYLHEAKNLALYHHEKWDGTGYPYGIKGEEIPLSARIMAVADVFDALVSKRSYKEAYDLQKAFKIIEESSGSHFDPLIVKAFLNVKEKIKMIAEERD